MLGSTKKTEAYMKIEAHRDSQNPDRTREDGPGLNCVVYRYENASGQIFARFYSGRKKKAFSHVHYLSSEEREEAIEKIFKWYTPNERSPRVLNVDDLLVSSWGYDQTNIDFYQVTRLSGKYSVYIRKIRANKRLTGNMHGKTSPIIGEFTGPEERHQACSDGGDSVSLSSYQHAFLEKPLSMENGKPVYQSFEYSSWA